MEHQHGRARAAWLTLALLGSILPGATAAGSDLEVRVDPARRDARPGREIVSHVRVANRGPEVATGIVIQVNLSDDFNPVRLEPPHGDCNPEWCVVPRLEPGERVGLKLVTVLCCVQPGAVREAWIRVTVDAANPDPRPANDEFVAIVRIQPGPR